MVLPVVMYGCEVWGFEKNNILEPFCLQFYKILLGLKKSTPNCILYGELHVDRYSIDIFIKCRMIAFWQRIVCNRQDKIAYCNYGCLNHRLLIEKGRFWGVKRDDRICDLCDLEHTGDEFHYLFECKYFERERKQLLPNIQKSNVLIYHLFNDNDIKNCITIAKFCKIILIAIN